MEHPEALWWVLYRWMDVNTVGRVWDWTPRGLTQRDGL